MGHLPEAIKTLDFLQLLAQAFKVPVMKHTAVVKDKIKIVAVCGGSGSFLLQDAIAANADIFITADFKYHEFFDADNKIVIVDIGHFETEQYTSEIFSEILRNKFTNFAPLIAKTITNPVCYFQSSANPNK